LISIISLYFETWKFCHEILLQSEHWGIFYIHFIIPKETAMIEIGPSFSTLLQKVSPYT
jgi:hypothetical protein